MKFIYSFLIFYFLFSQSLFSQAWLQQNSGFAEFASTPASITIIDENNVWLFATNVFDPLFAEASVTTDGGNIWTVHSVTADPD
ncbi:MAG: hypothetical protein ACHQFW_09695, partial [Chitinophagales bacterium]